MFIGADEAMSIIDLYRSGYDRGYQEAVAGMRRLPKWELLLRSPTALLPGIDTNTYVKGYADGYALGLTKEHWQEPSPEPSNKQSDGAVALAIVTLMKLLRGGR